MQTYFPKPWDFQTLVEYNRASVEHNRAVAREARAVLQRHRLVRDALMCATLIRITFSFVARLLHG